MPRVLETDHGAELYRQRQQLIEPVFAHTKFNRRIDPASTDGEDRRSERNGA
jgi:hypothetical protein